jgi:hypothetical protein
MMGKLISSPIECGWRNNAPIIYSCVHPGGPGTCVTRVFPTNCPLQDGMSYDEHLKRVLELGSKKQTLKQSLGIKPKRRNRKNCIHKGSLGCIPCKGVNCGQFKPKTE